MKKYIAIFALFCFSATATEIKIAKKSSFSGSATLGNSLGIGTFVSGYGQVPSLTSSLTVTPAYALPKFSGFPALNLSASGSLNWWWLQSISTSAFNANNRISYSDISLTLSAPKIVNFSDIGLSLSANIGLTAPISKISRTLNRMSGFKVGGDFSYQKADFSVAWLPSFATWAYSNAAMTGPCREAGRGSVLPPVINPQNINFELDQYLQELVISRSEERNSDGTCLVVGRQTVGVLSNSVRAVWAPGRHNVSLSFAWYINYLRPLSNNPSLAGEHASLQNFTQATLGQLAYAYQIPVGFDLSISGGIMSYQASFSKQGNFNFPFFDFVTPGKNQTQFFLQLTAGI